MTNAMTYDNCNDAVNSFCKQIEERGMKIKCKEKIRAHAGRGKYLMQDVISTFTNEVFYIICRPRGRWYPKPTEQVSDFGRPLDERLKFMIKSFGNGDESISGLNEDSLLWLLEKSRNGIQSFLVTIFPTNGEILWCSAQDAYEMIMRYGVLPQYSLIGMEGQTMCSIPTGWMKSWVQVLTAFPNIPSE